LRIGITMGDANGVGPELIIRTFLDARMRERCIPILYGSSRVINIYRKVLGVNKFVYNVIKTPQEAQPRKLNIIECIPDLERVDIGKPSEIGGKVAHLSLKRAIEDAQHQFIDALVTLPVDKASMTAYDEDFSGHTELLAKAFNVSDNLMLMVSDSLRVGVVTNHLAVKDISRNLTVDRIVQKATILANTLADDFSIQRPMIAILGLNPHAGDRGLIGNEDQEIVAKAVEALQEKNIQAFGPYPADGFFGSLTYKRFHGTLAMYHDQGLIPFKVLAGYDGVNYTAGIPFVRTSPDHGVAYDIAGKGTADLSSVRQAIFLAIDIHSHRTQNLALKENALEIKPLKPERKKTR
ncbi:MAG: 4-hydroxythreonine-4-phosphate dehydrogenase PdxA, partial [Bacteroidota bacterium]